MNVLSGRSGNAERARIGIVSTPTYVINGQAMGYGPEGEFTINAVRKTLGLPPVKIAKPKTDVTPKKKS